LRLALLIIMAPPFSRIDRALALIAALNGVVRLLHPNLREQRQAIMESETALPSDNDDYHRGGPGAYSISVRERSGIANPAAAGHCRESAGW
jgi:hypothetical protein